MHGTLGHTRSLFLKTRPVHLTVFVTRRCNLRCPSCFYQEARDAPGSGPELTPDEIRRAAGSMGRLLWVAIGGGEPFLRRDLPEIARTLHDVSRPAFLTIPTNGSLPEAIAGATEEILKGCPRSAVVLKLSLDGVGAEHDARRRAPGSFEKVMETHRRLAALARRFPRLEVGFNTLFSPESQGRMDEVIDFVRRLEGVRSHTLTMIRGRPARAGGVDLDLYRRAAARLEHLWGREPGRRHRFGGARLKAAQDRLQRRLIHRTLLDRRRVVPCYAGRLSLVLSESGDLHPCEERPDRSLGNVREAGYDVPAMLRSARGEAIRREIAGGGCHCSHECNFTTNILFNPLLVAGLLRECGRMALGLPEAAWARPGRPATRGERSALES